MRAKYLRNGLFYSLLIPITIFFALLSLTALVLPYTLRYWLITRWSHIFIFLCKWVCGLNYRVQGLEHLPKRPSVILCKHQSAWETLFAQVLFPPHAMVLKRELLWIPFFGWGLACLKPIAINRRSPRSAQHLIQKGVARLKAGQWILMFPEGTRVAFGQQGRYTRTGAGLALEAQVPIVPVTHNAGAFWPKGWMIQHSGTIDFIIGPALMPAAEAQVLTQQASQWIEGHLLQLTPEFMPAQPNKPD